MAADDALASHPAKYNFYREKIVSAAAEAKIAFSLPAAFETGERWLPEAELDVDFSDFERVLAELTRADGPACDLPRPRRRVDHRSDL